ncbi:hypothetical protein CHLRE_05g245451v5 [Chlamydomonas reinhardtii]|uniref:Peptidase S54 rhomboid domain-containing protein n=1 Tax=Chlamydomonas reinhardtii TaxID=3055 RepID=A0A2K3DS66_CHLRE|nr:uncharacterized protein CHLRE_05g245451v5 [Chlamydomonas reinhardtii]PNW83384.1 hypothetical protein CHLRE_05g245451v5 [Chlamydomonas reinhardtii]
MHLRFVTSLAAQPACDGALLASRGITPLLSLGTGLPGKGSSSLGAADYAFGALQPFGTWSGSGHGGACACADCASSAQEHVGPQSCASSVKHASHTAAPAPDPVSPQHADSGLSLPASAHRAPATAAGQTRQPLQPLGLVPPRPAVGHRDPSPLMLAAVPGGVLPGSHAVRGLLQSRLQPQPQQQALLQPNPHHHHQQQVRQLSDWRRMLPTWQDFRNSAEGPYRQVTNLFLAINVATYLVARTDRSVVLAMAAIPHEVARGEWHRLLTAGFLHTDFLHLLSNMLALHWLGPDLESAAGRGRFAAIYLLSVVAGSAAQYAWGGWGTVSWGASGGVAGLFAAYVTYRLRNRNYTGWSSADMSWVAQVVGLNVVLSMVAGGSLAHWAHLGGALGGAAAVLLLGPRYRWRNGFVVDEPLLPLFRSRR